MSNKIPKRIIDEIENKIRRYNNLTVTNAPNTNYTMIRISGFQRSYDSEKREKNREKLEKLKFDLKNNEIDLPMVNIKDIRDIESRYSTVFMNIKVEYEE